MADDQAKRVQRILDKLQQALGDTYDDIAFLDEGGMGAVFTGRHKRLGRTDAIKVLFADAGMGAMDRFRAEWQTIAALGRSPYIISIYEADESEEHNLAWLAEEFIEGESLLVRMGRGRIPRSEAVPLAAQIARGLEFAHDRGIIHRDVKPANVLIDKNTGEAILTDFGLARFLGDERLTQTNMAVGTLAYMCPESLSGAEPAPPSDVYSLGVVLYEMFTGCRLFEGPDVIQKQLTVEPPDPRTAAPDLPAPLANLILSMLSKKPEERPTMKAVRDTLEGTSVIVAEDAPTLPGGVAVQPPPGAAKAGPRWLFPAIGVVFAVAVLGVLGWFGRGLFTGGSDQAAATVDSTAVQGDDTLLLSNGNSGRGDLLATVGDSGATPADTPPMENKVPDQGGGQQDTQDKPADTQAQDKPVETKGTEPDQTSDQGGGSTTPPVSEPVKPVIQAPKTVAFHIGVSGPYRREAQRFQIVVNGEDTNMVGPQLVVWDRPANEKVSVALRQVGFVFSPAETTISFRSRADTLSLIFRADRR